MKKFVLGLISGILIFAMYSFVQQNPNNEYLIKAKTWLNITTQDENLSGEKTELANPASTYCKNNGGTLEIKDGTGGQYGICNFNNGSSCEERAYLRGECAPTKVDKDPISTNTDKPTKDEETSICTMEYAPVCAKVAIQCIKAPCEPIEQTFGNKCQMNANKLAKFLYEGECKTAENKCPEYTPPSPTFCTDGTIVDGGKDENGCQLHPICQKNK